MAFVVSSFRSEARSVAMTIAIRFINESADKCLQNWMGKRDCRDATYVALLGSSLCFNVWSVVTTFTASLNLEGDGGCVTVVWNVWSVVTTSTAPSKLKKRWCAGE